jgi:positive regulator of sigma E activity
MNMVSVSLVKERKIASDILTCISSRICVEERHDGSSSMGRHIMKLGCIDILARSSHVFWGICESKGWLLAKAFWVYFFRLVAVAFTHFSITSPTLRCWRKNLPSNVSRRLSV